MTKTAFRKPLCKEIENLLVLYTGLNKGKCITCGAHTEKKVVENYAARILRLTAQTLGTNGCSKWCGLLSGFTR